MARRSSATEREEIETETRPRGAIQEAGAILIPSNDLITKAAEWLIYLALGLPFAWWFFRAERRYNPSHFEDGPTFTQRAGYVGGCMFWPVLVLAFVCALPKAWRIERRRRLFGETPLHGLHWVRWVFDHNTPQG